MNITIKQLLDSSNDLLKNLSDIRVGLTKAFEMSERLVKLKPEYLESAGQPKPEVVTVDDVEMLEDLILSAVRQAMADAKKLSESEMGKITAGLGMPGLPF